MVCLYSFQEEAVAQALLKARPGNRILLVSPTGSGKTVMAADIARRFDRVLFVAHRTEINDQARLEMGNHVQVMSIHAALKYGPSAVDLLIIDEAHRAVAATYRSILEKYAAAHVIGLTATPVRTDGCGLVDVFDEMIQCSSTRELIDNGLLVPYRAFEAPDAALRQLAALRREGGDYALRELNALMNRPRLVGDVVREYQKHGDQRKAIAFAVSVEHSKALRDAFVAAGFRASHLDGNTGPRRRSHELNRLATGELNILCNVNLFTEGWDCPSVSCVIMARPTASLSLYLQSVGRGMRASPGKNDLLILDHAGNIERHGAPDLEREWSLESEKQRANRLTEVAELERLHALGFDSIEAELEDKRRLVSESYTPAECSKLLNVKLKSLYLVLRKAGGVRSFGTSNQIRYNKFDIDDIVNTRNAAALKRASRHDRPSPIQAAEYLTRDKISSAAGVSRSISDNALAKLGIFPTSEKSNGHRHLFTRQKAMVMINLFINSYAARDTREKFGRGPDDFWLFARRNALTPVFGTKESTRYLKTQVDELVAYYDQTYSPKESARLLNLPSSTIVPILAKRGILPVIRGVVKRFQKSSIDAICRS